MNMYPETLRYISALVHDLDEVSVAQRDGGIVIEPVVVSDDEGHLIGAVNFDSDGHGYFSPSETQEPDESDSELDYLWDEDDDYDTPEEVDSDDVHDYRLTSKGERMLVLLDEGYDFEEANTIAEAEQADKIMRLADALSKIDN